MIVLNQVIVLVLFASFGYVLKKSGKATDKTSVDLSNLLFYVFIPSLNLITFSENFSIKDFKEHYEIIIYSAAILAVLIVTAKLLAGLFTRDSYERGVYSYSLTTANFGYAGYAIMASVYGDKMLMKMMVFTLTLSIYTYTEGYKLLTDSKKMTLKKLFNPGLISMLVGVFIGIFNIQLPSFLVDTISKAGACMSPVSMIMTGMVIADYKISDVIFNKKAYIVSALRLIIIPLILCGALKLIGTDESIVLIALMTYAMPCGMNTIVFPRTLNKDCKLGASLAVISIVLSLITIPLVLSLV